MSKLVTTTDGEARKRIVDLADQCVMCGLCLPHCPTYGVARTEAESPRGRIAFAKNLANGHIDATPSVVEHLDQCLACMACEKVCPSSVRYGEILDATRSQLREIPRSSSPSLKWMNPETIRIALRIARVPGVRVFAKNRLTQKVLKPFGLDRAAREIPMTTPARHFSTSSAKATRGRIGLFLGCAAEIVDRDVHAAATALLQSLGYETVLPQFSCCCGALALHAGDVSKAKALASSARLAFEDVETILVSASGCFGALRDAFAGSGTRVRDIHEFLAGDARFDTLKFTAFPNRAALHMPCTQANVVRNADIVHALLRKIPQLEIVALPSEPGCCGAAGSYFLEHPQIADRLRETKVDQIQAATPDLLITSNVGCRMFLGNGLEHRGDALPVMHPIVLLAQQLQN